MKLLQKLSGFANFSQSADLLAPATRDDLSTSKNGPRFLTLLTWKCASCHQRRAHFQNRNFKKVIRSWSEHVILSILTCASRHNAGTFPNLACLRILTWKCASRSSWQIARTRRFSKPTCHCSTLQNHTSPERHSESRLSHLFFVHLLFSLFLFSYLGAIFQTARDRLKMENMCGVPGRVGAQNFRPSLAKNGNHSMY